MRPYLITILQRLGRLARPDPAVPARAWARAHWRSLAALALVVAAAWSFDAWLFSCGFDGCPSEAEIRAFRPAQGGRVLDRNGDNLGRLVAVRRINVPLDRIPKTVREAFIATEDRRFYRHHGVDWRGLARAALRNIRAMGIREGFSTITMQVARNTFVPRRGSDRSLARKLLEVRVARLMEHTLPKNRILEDYLNVIYLGNGVYGVEAASRDLFDKSVEDLTLDEAALLAALPKGPSAYTPRRNPDRAEERRNLVLGLMVREGYISPADAADARRQPIEVADDSWRPDPTDASYAMDAVRALVDSISDAGGFEAGDLTVYTTLDADAQRAAEEAVARHAGEIEDETGGRRGASLQGALVALDPRSGAIRALVGGRTYEPGGFNRALVARRQPGSAFKPFVYAAALAAGLSPASMVDDSPVEIDVAGRMWRPANYGDEYFGEITLRSALMHSANAATVRISHAVGESRVVDAARRNGISSPLSPVPSIALGAMEVTPIELVAAYAPFANGGDRVKPFLVTRIEAPDGTLLWSYRATRVRVMDPRDAFQVTSMLRSVVDHGTGRAVRNDGVDQDIPVAGKTGTTNDGNDVWFVGYTPTLVAGVWFGYDTPSEIAPNAAGGRFAAPAWADFYRDGWREREPDGAWTPPPGMVMREIDAETGELATQWCPITQQAWFKPGTEPTVPCRAHSGRAPSSWIAALQQQVSKAIRRLFRY